MLHHLIEGYLTGNGRLANPPLTLALGSNMQAGKLRLQFSKKRIYDANVVVLFTDMTDNHMQVRMGNSMQQLKRLGVGQVT